MPFKVFLRNHQEALRLLNASARLRAVAKSTTTQGSIIEGSDGRSVTQSDARVLRDPSLGSTNKPTASKDCFPGSRSVGSSDSPGQRIPSDGGDGSEKRKKLAVYVGAGVIGAGAAVGAAALGLGAVGFTSAGVAAGSVAAWWMSIAGPIAKGSIYATLQSAGAAGMGVASKAALASSGAGAGAKVAEVVNKIKGKDKMKDKTQDDSKSGNSGKKDGTCGSDY